jgi:hypothetical protein
MTIVIDRSGNFCALADKFDVNKIAASAAKNFNFMAVSFTIAVLHGPCERVNSTVRRRAIVGCGLL